MYAICLNVHLHEKFPCRNAGISWCITVTTWPYIPENKEPEIMLIERLTESSCIVDLLVMLKLSFLSF